MDIQYCPGTLAAGHHTYSRTCLIHLFGGHKVSHILPYNSPFSKEEQDKLYMENIERISLSGVQEKFSLILEKNKLRLIKEGEQGNYILKPQPFGVKNADQMPANEHLTMQVASQIFGIETAANALIFFKNDEIAYITKRFDIMDGGSKLAREDFASLAGRSPQTHGEHYKYVGNYLEVFEWMKKFLPAYPTEAPKLFRLLLFNYLFSNGDAHFKNFSILETPMGDFRLSPAYDLLNTRLHIDDRDFALEDGLLPKKLAKGKIKDLFYLLGQHAELKQPIIDKIFQSMMSNVERIKALIEASFLSERFKRTYLQDYQGRWNKLAR